MKTVYCPVKKNQINGDDCYLIWSIAEREVSARVLPDGVDHWDEEQRQNCLKCKYHAVLNDEDE